jgi:hypothetical protein
MVMLRVGMWPLGNASRINWISNSPTVLSTTKGYEYNPTPTLSKLNGGRDNIEIIDNIHCSRINLSNF